MILNTLKLIFVLVAGGLAAACTTISGASMMTLFVGDSMENWRESGNADLF